MFASIVVTVLVVPALLLFLLNAAMTEGYCGKVPQGSNAMGLVVPIFMAIIGGVFLLVATWVCVGKGGLAWVHVLSAPSGVVATVAALGVGLAANGVLIAWMERMGSWVPPMGLLCGVVGPLVLGGLLLVSAWDRPESVGAAPLAKIAGGGVAVVALLGLGMGAFGAFKYVQHSSENARRVLEDRVAFEQKWERIRARSPMEALREDYAQMSPESPLWVFIAALPDRSEPECREFIIKRALQVPDFDEQLGRTLTDEHSRYRHGCLDLIRYAPADVVKAEWEAPVKTAILTTTAQIKKNPSWLTPDEFSNPHPVEHVRAMVDAVARLGETQELVQALHELEHAIANLPRSDARDGAMEALMASAGG